MVRKHDLGCFFIRLRNTRVVSEAGFGDRDRFRDRQNSQLRSPIPKKGINVKICQKLFTKIYMSWLSRTVFIFILT